MKFTCSETIKKKKKKFVHASLRGCAAKFSFSKNRRDLKNEYFFLKICRILPNTYIKEQLPKIKFEIKTCLIFFKFPKMAKTVFDFKQAK